VLGTLAYMSPEQLRGVSPEQLTAASDLYSLGLVVYEMITGQPAVRGNTQAEIIAKHLYQQPPLPSHCRRDLKLPAAVDRVMMKVLAKEPHQRYQTAEDFAADLAVAFRKPGVSKVVWALIVLAVVATIVIGGYLAWPRDSSPTAPVEAPALGVDLAVQATPPRPFEKCNFVLLKPEITQIPKQIKDEDALLVYSGIDDQGGLKRAKDAKLPPGEYLYKFTCRGFKSVISKVRLQEDRQHPGRATVTVKIEPE
jgi:hypothetical protein